MQIWRNRAMTLLLLLAAGFLAACATHPRPAPEPLQEWSLPIPVVMGTEAKLTVVAPVGHEAEARQALAAAQNCLDRVELLMSNYREDSDVSRLNDAPVGEVVPLSLQTMDVLTRASEEAQATDGAFDATCGPILVLWHAAAARNKAPTADELAAAVSDTGWRNWRLEAGGAAKLRAGARIDLGGIAKKYAIDLAAKAMADAGASGGLIDVGGDIVCFGRTVSGQPWRISIVDPAHPDGDPLAILEVSHGAVCTSGNYERYDTIGGKRFSHIKDPRTGLSCDNCPSVTVIGKDALTAGEWSTALSVLGPEGLAKLPRNAGLEAMMVLAKPALGERARTTGGFRGYVAQGPKSLPAAAASRATPRRGHATYVTTQPAK